MVDVENLEGIDISTKQKANKKIPTKDTLTLYPTIKEKPISPVKTDN